MIKFNPTSIKKTVAELAREKATKVNLKELAKGREMDISSVRLYDDSVAKLLQNSNEVDVIIMKKGKVLSSKGTFVNDEEKANNLAIDAMCRIMKYVKKGEEFHFDTWA